MTNTTINITARLAAQSLRIVTVILITLGLSACGQPSGLQLGQEQVSLGESRQAIEMAELIRKVTYDRARERQPLKRFNQIKSVGCFDAQFTVNAGLPANLAKGLFASPANYPAKLRFANATEQDDRKRDFRGLSIQVDTQRAAPEHRQDFLFNSYPVLFAANPTEFGDFIKAQANEQMVGFFVSHLNALWILFNGLEKHQSLFGIDYFSTTPYRLGASSQTAVKYSVQPCEAEPDYTLNRDDENFLRQGMMEHLRKTPACFDFKVQPQTNADTMPIEDASVEWSQSDSPFVSVAKITINRQNFISKDNMQACEQMEFSPWNSLVDHRPLGGINRVRKAIYQQLGQFRQQLNAKLTD